MVVEEISVVKPNIQWQFLRSIIIIAEIITYSEINFYILLYLSVLL